MIVAEANLEAPYSESGVEVGKSSLIPLEENPLDLNDSLTEYLSSSCIIGSFVNCSAEYTRLVLRRMMPLPFCLQYSSKFIVPTKLCSMTCLLDVSLSIPARTEGLAAQSITQSAAGRAFRSEGLRMSPLIMPIPKLRRVSTFNSHPLREKLSTPMISMVSEEAMIDSQRVLPAKPRQPVIKIFKVSFWNRC